VPHGVRDLGPPARLAMRQQLEPPRVVGAVVHPAQRRDAVGVVAAAGHGRHATRMRGPQSGPGGGVRETDAAQPVGAPRILGDTPRTRNAACATSLPARRTPRYARAVKGDRVEIVVATDDGSRTYDIVATRAGRRVEITTGRGIVEVAEVTRTGEPVRTARFMASRVLALVEHPANEDQPTREPSEGGS
jgi:hypothetical protein